MKSVLFAATLLFTSLTLPLTAQTPFPPAESAYLAEFETLAQTKSSSARLLRSARKYPQTNITTAKDFCSSLRQLSNEQLRRIENRELEGEEGASLQYIKDRTSILKAIAPKYFCPEMAQKANAF